MKWLWMMGMLVACLLVAANGFAGVIFTDDFSGDGSNWRNERGGWSVANGVYDASSPHNSPPTYTSANTGLLTDFILDVDINGVRDGGLWLRSSFTGSVVSGVLLVTGGYGGSYNGLYWHTLNSDQYSGPFSNQSYTGLLESNAQIRVVVKGDVYEAYVNGATSPLTTLTTSAFDSGYVGLYDFSAQTFDNVRISTIDQAPVPEPSTIILLGLGALGLLRFRKK